MSVIPSSFFFFYFSVPPRDLHSFPTRRSSDLLPVVAKAGAETFATRLGCSVLAVMGLSEWIAADEDEYIRIAAGLASRSEEHTSELQSLRHLVCRLLLEKKKKK